MELESKKRIESLIAAAKSRTGGSVADLTEAVQALCSSIDGIIYGNITDVTNEKITGVGAYKFYNDVRLTSVNFPSVTVIGDYSFYGCGNLKLVDFPSLSRIGSNAFNRCVALSAVVLRGDTVVSLSDKDAFGMTPLHPDVSANSAGYFYIRRARIDTYKIATNWVVYAERFRVLEDYTVDGTTMGALDLSKI